MAVNSYRELKVWQLGMELAREVYLLTGQFPKHETYRLSSQVQRAAVSIPANIGERHVKRLTKKWSGRVAVARGAPGVIAGG